MSKILAFAGQGSQYYHMGRELYEKSLTFRHWLQKADGIVGDRLGFSIIEKIYDPMQSIKEPMHDIKVSHPALFAVQYAAAQMFLETESEKYTVVGFSLGEMVAMAAAEIWSFETAFSNLLEQVDWLCSECVQGHLIAVFAPTRFIDEALISYKNQYVYAISSFANLHTLSMPENAAPAIETSLKNRNISFQKLPVSYPFHSPWLDPMKEFFTRHRETIQYSRAKRTFASCTKQEYIEEVDEFHLWQTVRDPLVLDVTFRKLFKEDDIIIDCSPTSTIKALLRSHFGLHSQLYKQAQSLMSPLNSMQATSLK